MRLKLHDMGILFSLASSDEGMVGVGTLVVSHLRGGKHGKEEVSFCFYNNPLS